MPPVALGASLKVKKANLAAFNRQFKKHAANCVKNEPGCLAFEVCAETQDPTKVFLYEVYVDQAALDSHAASAHLAKHLAIIGPWLDGRPRLLGTYTRITAPNK